MEGNMVEHKKPLVSPKGAKSEYGGKLEGIINILAKVVYIVFVPQQLHNIYTTEGFSRRFVHLSMAAFALLLIYIGFSKLIGQRSFMLCLFIAMVGFMASYDWEHLLSVYLVGGLFFFGIMFSVMIIYHKNNDRA